MYKATIFSGVLLFGCAGYIGYQYEKSNAFMNSFYSSNTKKIMLHTIHEKIASKFDSIMDPYENNNKINKYRQILLSYAKGDVLETGVGTSRNVLNYLAPVKSVTGVDWSLNMLEVAMLKTANSKFSYLQQDVTQLQFEDNKFDTVVDTFGLEYYLDPKSVLGEMKRVCKKNGIILLMASGETKYPWLNILLEIKKPKLLSELGYFAYKDWDKVITEEDFEIIRHDRALNGSIYIYILKNSKKQLV